MVAIIFIVWTGASFLLAMKLSDDEVITADSPAKAKRRFLLVGGPILWVIWLCKSGYSIIVNFIGGKKK